MTNRFYPTLIKKVVVMIGFTYFSVAVATHSLTDIIPALLAGGLYGFTELARHYRINAQNTTLKAKKKKVKEIHFLI